MLLGLPAADPRTPRLAKLVSVAIAAYAPSSIDLIPDVIPVLDHLDDLLIVPAGILLVVRLVPTDVMADMRGGRGRQSEIVSSVGVVWPA